MTGTSTGASHLAFHAYPSSSPRVTSSSVPEQKLASEQEQDGGPHLGWLAHTD